MKRFEMDQALCTSDGNTFHPANERFARQHARENNLEVYSFRWEDLPAEEEKKKSGGNSSKSGGSGNSSNSGGSGQSS